MAVSYYVGTEKCQLTFAGNEPLLPPGRALPLWEAQQGVSSPPSQEPGLGWARFSHWDLFRAEEHGRGGQAGAWAGGALHTRGAGAGTCWLWLRASSSSVRQVSGPGWGQERRGRWDRWLRRPQHPRHPGGSQEAFCFLAKSCITAGQMRLHLPPLTGQFTKPLRHALNICQDGCRDGQALLLSCTAPLASAPVPGSEVGNGAATEPSFQELLVTRGTRMSRGALAAGEFLRCRVALGLAGISMGTISGREGRAALQGDLCTQRPGGRELPSVFGLVQCDVSGSGLHGREGTGRGGSRKAACEV